MVSAAAIEVKVVVEIEGACGSWLIGELLKLRRGKDG